MQQELIEMLERRLDLMAFQVTQLGVVVTVGAALMLVFGIWNVRQTRDLQHVRQQAIGTQAVLDSLREANDALALRLVENDEQAADLDRRMGRLAGGVRPTELLLIRAWIRRLEGRIDGNAGRLATLEDRLERDLLGVLDSVMVSRARLVASVDSRFSAAERDRAALAVRDEALDEKIGAIKTLDRKRAWRRTARDVVTVVGAGMIIPHMFDHGGR